MNPEDFHREDLISGLSPALAAAGCAGAFLLWLLTLRGRSRFPSFGFAWSGIGFLLAASTIWCGLQFLGNFVSLATSWPLVALALGGALAAEAIVLLYRFEKTLVSPARGRWLLALRLAALVLLLLVLAQPVRSFLESREIDREIAILVDESDSMLLSDQRLDASEKLDRAALLGAGDLSARPPFREAMILTDRIAEAITAERDAITSAPAPAAGLESRALQLPAFFEETGATNEELAALLAGVNDSGLPGEVKQRLGDYRTRSRDGLPRILQSAQAASKSGDAEELVKQFDVALEELRGITDTLALTASRADLAYFEGLDADARRAIIEASETPRLELARRVLEAPVPRDREDESAGDLPLLERLREDYNLRLFRFARDVSQVGELEAETWSAEMGEAPARSQTDLTGALEHILENTAPESLAGVLLLSDGRHNGGVLPEDSLRQLAVQNTPLSAVPLGGNLGPVDISLLGVKAPESIYLDDRVVVSAEAKLDGLLGETVIAELLANGEVVDTVDVEVADVTQRSEIKFVHRPEDKGILDYRIRLQPDDREIFRNNNEWDFKVAVTDDRTNVLLVDGFPRWEFRYLRNLFYGRDKSVHLQYVLLNPDEIYRGRRPDLLPASATRAFGDAEATALPANAAEWSLFDVIILGDVPASALEQSDWEAIREAVTKRGAMLVCVAGARHMPHGHSSEVLRNLLPVNYQPGGAVQFESPEPAYHVKLTAAGQTHPVTSQSTSRALNEERWASFPPMQWRYVAGEVKDTAEVLAYARPVGAPDLDRAVTPDGSPGSVEAAIEQLANRKQIEKDNAVITVNRAGLGKVLLLSFDQTWRLRYGVGDTYHHRFWGQVTRWGAGENLRSGNELVRLGSDRLSYTPNDSIEVVAKVLDEERRPVVDAEVEVEVWRGEEKLTTQMLSYRSESSGLYETSLTGLREEGEYRLELVGPAVEEALAAMPDGPDEISTELLVVTTRNPVELAELTADRNFLNRATTLTGGSLVEIDNLESLLDSFGAPKETLTERRNVTLWDTWPLLLAFLGCLTTEWILRRRSGLV